MSEQANRIALATAWAALDAIMRYCGESPSGEGPQPQDGRYAAVVATEALRRMSEALDAP